MDLGVPIVGTYDSSLDEMIIPGETGFLAANGDCESLRQNIEQLLVYDEAQMKKLREGVFHHVSTLRQADPLGSLVRFYNKTQEHFRRLHHLQDASEVSSESAKHH